MEPSDFGSNIDASEAHGYIENYKTQRNALIEKVLPWVPDYAPQEVKDSATFHKSKVIAFIFNAALIKSLFEGPDAAQYFAVFLGANGLTPNVVAVGLVEGPEPNSLVASAPSSNPEHPTLVVGAKYPGLGNGPIYITE